MLLLFLSFFTRVVMQNLPKNKFILILSFQIQQSFFYFFDFILVFLSLTLKILIPNTITSYCISNSFQITIPMPLLTVFLVERFLCSSVCWKCHMTSCQQHLDTFHQFNIEVKLPHFSLLTSFRVHFFLFGVISLESIKCAFTIKPM
jgi:hypothetical protein